MVIVRQIVIIIGSIRESEFAGALGVEWGGGYVASTFDIKSANNFSWKNLNEKDQRKD